MFWFIKQEVSYIIKVSYFIHRKHISLNNQQCMILPPLVNLHPNEYGQSLLYCPFALDLDRCIGSCNTLNDLSNKLCVPKKTEYLNLNAFNMITGINININKTKKINKTYVMQV